MKRTSEPRRRKRNRSSDESRDPDRRRTDATATVEGIQRRAGNQAVQALHEQGRLQAKLEVSTPRDPAEREAERVADEVVGADSETARTDADDGPEIRRSPAESGDSGTVAGDTERRVHSSLTGGKPLPESTRSAFESRFGRDFSDVRVHTGAAAEEAARSIGAEAFTLGSEIGFAEGAYDPASNEGRRLLAHELTHVAQQRGDGSNVQLSPTHVEDNTMFQGRSQQHEQPRRDIGSSTLGSDRFEDDEVERHNRAVEMAEADLSAIESRAAIPATYDSDAEAEMQAQMESMLEAMRTLLPAPEGGESMWDVQLGGETYRLERGQIEELQDIVLWPVREVIVPNAKRVLIQIYTYILAEEDRTWAGSVVDRTAALMAGSGTIDRLEDARESILNAIGQVNYVLERDDFRDFDSLLRVIAVAGYEYEKATGTLKDLYGEDGLVMATGTGIVWLLRGLQVLGGLVAAKASAPIGAAYSATQGILELSSETYYGLEETFDWGEAGKIVALEAFTAHLNGEFADRFTRSFKERIQPFLRSRLDGNNPLNRLVDRNASDVVSEYVAKRVHKILEVMTVGFWEGVIDTVLDALAGEERSVDTLLDNINDAVWDIGNAIAVLVSAIFDPVWDALESYVGDEIDIELSEADTRELREGGDGIVDEAFYNELQAWVSDTDVTDLEPRDPDDILAEIPDPPDVDMDEIVESLLSEG